NYDLRIPTTSWNISAVPRTDPTALLPEHPKFPEGDIVNNLDYGKNRARINWYRLDPNQYRKGGDNTVYASQILEKDVFPQLDQNYQTNPINSSFDISYYPMERGPYNYDLPTPTLGVSAGCNSNSGVLNNPKTRWGGIMRPLQNADFEAANIEFIEMWVMSPFNSNGGNATGGDVYFNLGNVSEDVLRDSRMYFENGIPAPGSSNRIDNTNWGRVPRVQPIVNAFDNDPAVRAAQDIGFDGLDDAAERIKFDSVFLQKFPNNSVFSSLRNDPSSDNFIFFNDTTNHTSIQTSGTAIRQRYKYHNNPQGNSPSNQESLTNQSGTNIPDSEDLNRDNTLSETEAYYEYKLHLEPEPGTTDGSIKDSKYIVDKVKAKIGGEDVWFYQVKIPVDQYTSKVGDINDFRSVRYMRMYMHNWNEQVTLRMARLQLVRNQWRRYRRDLIDPFVGTPCGDTEGTSFDVVSVNYEQNSKRKPYPYLIPPGIRRELSVNPTQSTQQNEQALQISVCGICDGDARGIYKNLNLDMRTFKRLRMFVHAERREEDPNLQDGQMSVFMRIGSDYDNNYYEYEIPLKLTTGTFPDDIPVGTDTEAQYKKLLWLSDNSFDFTFDLLRSLKTKRNNDPTASPNIPYMIDDPSFPGHKVRIKGNPDLGYAKGVMIGLRNPTDDAAAHCATIWVNELRASGFDERGGTAAIARLDVTLADLGNVTASGNYSSIGWGSLEQRVAQRSKEENLQYDVAGTLELGKFLPKVWGIRLPFFAQYSNQIKTPQFDPYQLDIPFADVIAGATSQQQRDSLREQAVTINSIRGFNFTNVRKDRTGTKTAPMPWDIENFSVTYAYNQVYKSDPTIAKNILDQYRGALDYSFSMPQPLDIRPFKFIKNDLKGWLAIIKDFNFNPLPNSFTFSNQMNRQVGQIKYRFSGDDEKATWYDKRFTWDRNYNLQWNLTKSIGLTFSAINNAIVDEPKGLINTKAKEDEIWKNIQKFGRNRAYSHNLSVNYTVPINKIPLLDWVQIKATYAATYNWSRASLNTDSLGNVVGNTQNRQINADLDFTRFYNKWGYLKKINAPIPDKDGKSGKGGKDGKGGDLKSKFDKAGKGKGGEEETDKDSKDKDPKDKDSKDKDSKDKDGKDKKMIGAPDGKGGKPGKDDKTPPKPHEPTLAERIVLRPLMMIRKGRATYQEQFGTIIPGFMPSTHLLGMNSDWQAPGFDFVAGMQPNTRWLDAAASKGWLSENPYLNQQIQQTYSQTINAQLNLEPFDEFRIDVTAQRTYTKNHTELFKRDSLGAPNHSHLTPMDMGNLTVSFFTLNTLFIDKTGDDYSKLFKDFEANRLIVSRRLGSDAHTATIDSSQGYAFGYGRYSQAALIPAFLSAYTGQNAQTYNLNVFNTIPLPNWKMTYNGLVKFKSIAKVFSSISITHGYKSTLTVNSYRSNLFQHVDADGFFSGNIDPVSRNFYSIYEIPDMVITEQLQPLIGIDVRTKKDLTARVEYKKSRTLTMNFTDYQINETRTDEFVLGAGYRIKGLKLPFTIGKKKPIKKEEEDKTAVIGPDGKKKAGKKPKAGTTLDNDLNFKLDVSYRDDITFNRPLDQDPVRTRGLRTLRASPSIDYQLNKNLNIRLFYDYNSTVPATSASFPITTQQGGVTIRFMLGR
ncbi:MAG: gliding motility protein SprA, partial [Bacteroidota bacterium]